MTYRIKIVRMLDGKRVESFLGQEMRSSGFRYDRGAAVGMAEQLWTKERRTDTGLVAVELVEVT